MGSTPVQAVSALEHRRFRGCSSLHEYDITGKLGEGTFGVVSKAVRKRGGQVFALKMILMHNEKEGFPITALREVKLMKLLSHPNILRLEEMVVERMPADAKGKSGRKRATLYMVTPYMEHDLSGMLTNPEINFSMPQIKCYLLQLLEGLRYLHDANILHRDMKAANILISNAGILQIADFGLARHYDGPTPQPGHGNGEATRDYTSLVVTRWYRPPELLLTLKRYTPAIDLWGVGCVFAEMFECKPILDGRTDIDQCVKIFALVGSPTDDSMPGWSDLPGCEGQRDWARVPKGNIDERFGHRTGPQGLKLLKQLLCLDWRRRINAVDALQHEFFKTEPLPAKPGNIPRYEDSHELDSRRRGKGEKPPAPPKGGDIGMGPEEWNGHGGTQFNNHRGGGAPGHGRDHRGPPGYAQAPPRHHDQQRRGAPPPSNPPGARQPAWQQQQQQGDPSTRAAPLPTSSLPPRPPTSEHLPRRPSVPPPHRNPAPERFERDRGGGGGGGGAVDTYIPSYQQQQQDPANSSTGTAAAGRYDTSRGFSRERDTYDRDRDRGRASREGTYEPQAPPRRRYHDADAPPPPRERDRRGGGGFYDQDAPPRGGRYNDLDAPPRGHHDGYRERERRTRSRSPDRRERTMPRDRDRDYYR